MAKPLPPVKNTGTPTRPVREGGEQAPRAGYRVGRKAGDPNDVRSSRIVQRVHPHLVEVVDELAREEGLTRSLFIERILIKALNKEHGAHLDMVGRWQPYEDPDDRPRLVRAKPFAIGERIQKEWEACQNEQIEQSLARRSPTPVDADSLRLPMRQPTAKRKPTR